MELENLPSGWNWKYLDDLAVVVRGGSPRPKGDPRYFGGTIPWIMISDISREKGKFISKTKDHVTEEGAKLSRFLKSGTLILSNSGTICVPKILAVDGCIHDGFIAFLELKPEVDKLFLYHYLDHIRPMIKSENHQGITQVNLNKDIVKKIPIPLPPLAEQQRIVARVEALLTQVNAARERLSRVPLIMKKFRQAVLAAACSGRLTEGWREENLEAEPASELLQKIKPDVRGKKVNAKQATNDFFEFDQFELPDSWIWTTTSDICTEISDGDHYPPPKIPSGVPFIVISNISSGSIDFTRTMFASQKYYDDLANNRKPQFRDILYTVTGSYGIPVIVDTHREFCFQRHIALLRPHPIIPSEFLWILMKSDLVYKQSTSIATGIAQLTVPLSGLRVLKIPLPPLAEQYEIVRRVGMLFEHADAIDREVVVAGRRCERLTQAVLGKAFSGRL